ncbi:hypothetical protein EK21DRAFT_113854 [Setomelanomma holmii]|uniref:Uncharacterized protein n=1 Tax=Setomelanomma holmii TaxID=210430 RepID=A0A9P4LKB7_9PLEO|nr:hypothetical protein EK21DRAFT_113854 [Setomelanomma holmii]
MISDARSRPHRLPIERVKQPSEEKPPWSGIEFTFPVGSDDLSDALRSRYPKGTTLRERKHMAAIEFLQNELRQMQSAQPCFNATDLEDSATSKSSSPDSDGNEVRSRLWSETTSCDVIVTNGTARSPSNVVQGSDVYSGNTIIDSTPSSAHKLGHQIVFSVANGRQQQPRTRRRMTKEEKLAYKKTRERKACAACRRQKAKCTHGDNVNEEQPRQGTDVKRPKRQHSLDAGIGHLQGQKLSTKNGEEDEFALNRRISTNLHEESRIQVHTAPATTEPLGDNTPYGQGSAQNEIPRYVQSPVVSDQYGVPVTTQSGSSWPGFYAPHAPDVFGPDFTQLQQSSSVHSSHSMPPLDNVSPLDASYPSTFADYIQGPWTEPQEIREPGTEPNG